MPKRKPAKRSPLKRLTGSGVTLGKAGDNALKEDYLLYQRLEVPGGSTLADGARNAAFEKARRLKEQNYWLRQYFPLKLSLINYGLSISANPKAEDASADAAGAEENVGIDEWLSEEIQTPEFKGDKTLGFPNQAVVTRREKVLKFIEEAITEFILLSNCIVFWTKELMPVTLPPERCRYKDVLGIETLFYLHGLSAEDRKLLPPEQQKRFETAELAIGEDPAEMFKVLKMERTGFGLSWPSVQSIFRTVSAMESMEMGESSYAYMGRQHYRQHKLGHQIDQGPMSGKPTHFWTKKWGNQVRAVVEGKIGFLGDLTTRHDHEVIYPHEDLAYFDEKKWLSPEHRLTVWGGALAHMLVMKGVNTYLTQMLRAEIVAERDRLRMFLESVINQGFAPPVPIKITWSNLIFSDSRIMAEMLKFGVSCGAVSQSTFRQEAGFDDDREAAKKVAEAEAFAKEPQQFKPAYDPAHGDPNDQGGKPPGGEDADRGNPS